MNLRQVILIYECNEMYLYEIIEDYKDARSQEERDEIFRSFCDSLWSCSNKRRTYLKTIHFNVKKDLLQTELGQVFHTWSDLTYKYYKSMTKEEHWCAIIRQKINNIYTRYFDPEVILGKEYLDLLKTPKRLYYQWISGIDMDAASVTEQIDDAIAQSLLVKQRLQKEKMVLSWEEYKQVVEEFLLRCFCNSKLIEDYEDTSSIASRLDFLTEDHFYAAYINRCLEGEIRKWQKQYYGIRDHKAYKRCKNCGILMEHTSNRMMYCRECGIIINREKTRLRMKARREGICLI